VLVAVHAWQRLVAASHTWCIGLHALQSALLEQLTVGLPLGSVSQVSPAGMQIP
jgi:hypothetical protein